MWPRRSGDTFASLAVAAIVLAAGLGLPVVNRAVPGLRPASMGTVHEIGAGVRMTVPAGAQIDTGLTRPRRERGVAVFRLGEVSMIVGVGPYTGSLEDASARLRDRITLRSGFRIVGAETAIVTPGQLAGKQGRYASEGHDGRYAVFGGCTSPTATGVALLVEVTVRGPVAELVLRGPAIDATIASLSCRRSP